MSLTLRAEWEKVRRLYTPRVVVGVILVVTIGAALIAQQVGSDDPASAISNGAIGLDIAALFGTALFAVWMYGTESAQGLLARTFTSEPRRSRVLAAKLLLAVAVPAVALSVAALLAAPLIAAGVTDAGGSITTPQLASELAGHVVQGLVVAPTVFGLACLVGNLAGGLAATFALLEILPGLLSVSGLSDYGLPIAAEALLHAISADATKIPLGQALAVIAAWSAVSVALGITRVRRADIA